MAKQSDIVRALLILVILFVVMELALIWALGIAPPDRNQGDIQRIFYFHLGSVWPAFMAFFYVAFASIRYLVTRLDSWDRKARVAGQIGLCFCTMAMITGPIWAKPTWGVWWAWDARLTSTFVLWLIFLGYVILRDYVDDRDKARRLSAVLGILGAAMVPLVYFSTRWFENQHPGPVLLADEDSGIKDPHMLAALFLALAAFSLLSYVFWKRGTELLDLQARLRLLRMRVRVLEEER